ncbi:unnamed protein product [Prorocentrum cordatum]|uniref:C3H1-type domain-containing protein n=1 Tax=Prorocentrum cordatum TaxID=2364126 RepID=A0ABN9SH78_9DINO|nr:unnamed protein product [Polarella glacialis]
MPAGGGTRPGAGPSGLADHGRPAARGAPAAAQGTPSRGHAHGPPPRQAGLSGASPDGPAPFTPPHRRGAEASLLLQETPIGEPTFQKLSPPCDDYCLYPPYHWPAPDWAFSPEPGDIQGGGGSKGSRCAPRPVSPLVPAPWGGFLAPDAEEPSPPGGGTPGAYCPGQTLAKASRLRPPWPPDPGAPLLGLPGPCPGAPSLAAASPWALLAAWPAPLPRAPLAGPPRAAALEAALAAAGAGFTERRAGAPAPAGAGAPPNAGSAGHHLNRCKPCAFANTKGCKDGPDCAFCHLCEPGEKKRRKKALSADDQDAVR